MNEQSPISAIYLATAGHFAVVITCYAPSYFITPDLLSIVKIARTCRPLSTFSSRLGTGKLQRTEHWACKN